MSDERGFTLIEVVIATAIGMVVMAVCANVLASAHKRSSEVERRTDSQLRARVAIDTAQRSLRAQACLVRLTGAPLPPIVAATATSVTFYADLAGTGTPVRRKLELGSDGAFTETVWADANGTGTPLVRRLAAGLDTRTSPFTYFAYSGSPPQPRTVLTPGTGGLSSTDRARVAKVDIGLSVPWRGATQDLQRTQVRSSALVRLTDPDGSVVPLCV